MDEMGSQETVVNDIVPTKGVYTPSPLLHHASASKTDVLLACQYWASPALQLPEDIFNNPAARFGSAFHKTMELHLLETFVDFAAIAEEFDVDQKRLENYYDRGSKIIDALLKKNEWDKHPRMVETKLAYDPFTDKARVLDAPGPRSYSGRTPTELPGTQDLMIPNVVAWQSPTESALVLFDWKTGQSDYNADTNAQLSSLGLMGARLLEQSYVHVAILRLDDEFAEISQSTRNATELKAHRIHLKKALSGALEDNPALRPGTWCKYCPALEVCPVHRDPYLPVEIVESAVGPEQIRMAYPLLIAAEQKLAKARERVKRYVEMNGMLDLDSGKRLKIIEYEEELLSKASIKRALGNVEGAELIEDLRRRGVVEKSQQSSLRMVNIK